MDGFALQKVIYSAFICGQSPMMLAAS